MLNFRMLKLSDMKIWLICGLMVFIGILSVFSATASLEAKASGDIFASVIKHSLSLGVAMLFMLFFTYIDYRHLNKFSYLIYLLIIVILGSVIFVGFSSQGAQRWLDIGVLSFQPSEISKLMLIIVLAAYLKDKRGKIKSLSQILPIAFIVAVPFALIFKQPDLGTSIVFIAITLGMLLWAEISVDLWVVLLSPAISAVCSLWLPLWILFIMLLLVYLFLRRLPLHEALIVLFLNIGVGIAVPFLWGALKAYQKQRILSFLNPGHDPLGIGYHSFQSKIALGGGGLFGQGYLHGTQTQFQFIPVQHADFIFSVIGEEFGFLGSVMVVILIGALLWRIYHVAINAADDFGSLLAVGIFTLFSFHFIVNILMVEGLLPVVGIPLPFLSYGGSFMVINLAGIGIIQSIAMRRQKIIF